MESLAVQISGLTYLLYGLGESSPFFALILCLQNGLCVGAVQDVQTKAFFLLYPTENLGEQGFGLDLSPYT